MNAWILRRACGDDEGSARRVRGGGMGAGQVAARWAALVCVTLAGALQGCATPPPAAVAPSAVSGLDALRLSEAQAAPDGTPVGWQPWIIRPDKRPTRYQLITSQVSHQPRQVLQAVADSAASGLWVPLRLAEGQATRIAWSWRTDAMIEGADSSRPETEDAPVRLILAFDGDWRKLSLREQMLAETARLLLGRQMPYATLVYTWDASQPVETVLPNAHTGRIMKKVVESGRTRIGQWLGYQRNIVADFVEAFGEAPGPLIGVGVLTDTDNTRTHAEGWYGDIRFLAPDGSVLTAAP